MESTKKEEQNAKLEQEDNASVVEENKKEIQEAEDSQEDSNPKKSLTQEQIIEMIKKLSKHQGTPEEQKRQQLEIIRQMAPLINNRHSFWDTQPVPKESERFEELKDGPIKVMKVEDIRKELLPLPKGYEWAEVDLNDDNQVLEVFKLLRNNYVEDAETMFRFDYTPKFLRWALTPPGYFKSWHLAVKSTANNKLYGFISGIPVKANINDVKVKMAEINFLCVHSQLRNKKLAPLLIKEITRRINLQGIFQAAYTVGKVIPKPYATVNYYHRSLNPKKLVEIGFNQLPAGKSMANYVKLNKPPTEKSLNIKGGVREMRSADLPQVFHLLKKQLDNYAFKFNFSQADVGHHLLPQDGVIFTYVVEDENKKINSFVSFYNIPQQVLKENAQGHKSFNSAFLYYYAFSKENSLAELIKLAIVKASEQDYDVLNCLDLMDNDRKMLKGELNFGSGSGTLHHYFYNYQIKQGKLDSKDIGAMFV